METIFIAGDKIAFPRVCPNCLQPADDQRLIVGSRSAQGNVTTRRIEVPFCHACVTRLKDLERRADRAAWLITAPAFLIAWLSLLMVGVWGYGLDFSTGMHPGALIGTAAAAAFISAWVWITVALTRRDKLIARDPEAKKIVDSITIPGFEQFGPHVTEFAVTNLAYARLLAEANPGATRLSRDPIGVLRY